MSRKCGKSTRLSQFTQFAKERRELEKVLIEQKLANRTGPGQDGPSKLNKDFSERQARIKEELRRAMGETEEVSGEYSAKLGFDLYFDYVLDIPEMHQSCQIVYGVYRQGIAMLRALKTDAHVVEVTPDETKRSLFGEKKNVSGIKVLEDAMLFFELQFTNRVDKFQQGSSYGWTALDIFTSDKTLTYPPLTQDRPLQAAVLPPAAGRGSEQGAHLVHDAAAGHVPLRAH